jgi:hypothetical protein
MTALNELETLAKDFSSANYSLTELKKELSSEIEEVRITYYKKIKTSVEKVMSKKSELEHAILANKHLFEKPRTMIISGVRLGFQKSKDKISWDDDRRVVELIEKKMDADIAAALLKTEKKPVRETISKLSECDLRKIGCRIEKGTDRVLIKTLDSEIDKFVSSLMKETELN